MALDYSTATGTSVRLKYTGKGYLDAKMQPVETLDDLNKITITHRFVGLTVLVLKGENGEPTEYWLKNGTKNTDWEVKNSSCITGNDIEDETTE